MVFDDLSITGFFSHVNFLNIVILARFSVFYFRPSNSLCLRLFNTSNNWKEPVLLKSKEVTTLSQLASICFDVCRAILLSKKKGVQTLLQNQIQLGTKIGRVVANNCRVAQVRQRGITKITPNLLHNNHLRNFWLTASFQKLPKISTFIGL